MAKKIFVVRTTGLRELRQKYQQMIHNGKIPPKGPSVRIGYGTDYALFVHEHLLPKHESPTQAKFLTGAVRKISGKKLSRLVAKTLDAKGTFLEGLMLCGFQIKIISQGLVPIETGLLRSTCTVRKD